VRRGGPRSCFRVGVKVVRMLSYMWLGTPNGHGEFFIQNIILVVSVQLIVLPILLSPCMQLFMLLVTLSNPLTVVVP
jgi:hypothetical protein